MKLPPPNPAAVLPHLRTYAKAVQDELRHQRIPTPASVLRTNDGWMGKLPAPAVVCTLLRTLTVGHRSNLKNSPISVAELFSKLLSGPWEGYVEQQMADALLLLRPNGPAPECEETAQLRALAAETSQLTAWISEQTVIRLDRGQDTLHANIELTGIEAGGNLFPLFYGVLAELDRSVHLSSDVGLWRKWSQEVPVLWERLLEKGGAPDPSSVRELFTRAEVLNLPVSLSLYAIAMSHPAMLSTEVTFQNIVSSEGKKVSRDDQLKALRSRRQDEDKMPHEEQPSPLVYPHVADGKPVWRSLCLQASDGPLVRERNDGTQLRHPYLYALARHMGLSPVSPHVVLSSVSPEHAGFDDFEPQQEIEASVVRSAGQEGSLALVGDSTNTHLRAKACILLEDFRRLYHMDVKTSPTIFRNTSGLFPALGFLPQNQKASSYLGTLEYHLYTILYNISRGHPDKLVRSRAFNSASTLHTYASTDELLTYALSVELLAKDVGYWDVIPTSFVESLEEIRRMLTSTQATAVEPTEPKPDRAAWLPLSLEPLTSQGEILKTHTQTRYVHPWTYALALKTLPDPSVLFRTETVLHEVSPLDHQALSWDAHGTPIVPPGPHAVNFQSAFDATQDALKGPAFRAECLAQNKGTDWRFATWILPNGGQSTEHKLRILLYQFVYRLSHLNLGRNLAHSMDRLLDTITKGTVEELVESCVTITSLIEKEDFPLDVPDAYGDAVTDLISKLQRETASVEEKVETQPRTRSWLHFSVAVPEDAVCAPCEHIRNTFRNTFLHPWLYALALKRLGPKAASSLVSERSQRGVIQYWSSGHPDLPHASFLWTPPLAELGIAKAELEEKATEDLKPEGCDEADWNAFVLEADGLHMRRHNLTVTYDPNTEWAVLPVPPGGPKISATDHLRALAYQLAFQLLHSAPGGQSYIDLLQFRDRILDPSLSTKRLMQEILDVLKRCPEDYRLEIPDAYMTSLEKLAAELHLTKESPAEKNAALNIRASRAEAILQSASELALPPNVAVQGEAVVADFHTYNRKDPLSASVPVAPQQTTLPARGKVWQSMYSASGSEPYYEMPRQSVEFAHPWLLAAAHIAGFSPEVIDDLVREEAARHGSARAQFSTHASTTLLQKLHSFAERHEKAPEGKDSSIYRTNLVDRFKAAVSKLDHFSPGDGEDTPWLGDDVAFAAQQWFHAKAKRGEEVCVNDMLEFYGYTLLFQLAYWSSVPTEEIAKLWSKDRRTYGRSLVKEALRLSDEDQFDIPDSILATLQYLLLREGSSPMDENYIQSGSLISFPLPAKVATVPSVTRALAESLEELTWTWDETHVTIRRKNETPLITCYRSSLASFEANGITYTTEVPPNMEGSLAGSYTRNTTSDAKIEAPMKEATAAILPTPPKPLPSLQTPLQQQEGKAPVKEEHEETYEARHLAFPREDMTFSYDSRDSVYATTRAGTRAQFALRVSALQREVLSTLDIGKDRWVSLLTASGLWEPAHPYTFDLFHLAMARLHLEFPRDASRLGGHEWSSEVLRHALDGGNNLTEAHSTARPWDGGASLILAVESIAAREEAAFRDTVPTGTSKAAFDLRSRALRAFSTLLSKMGPEAVDRLQSDTNPLQSLNDAKDVGVDGTAWSLTYHVAHRVILHLKRTRGASLRRAIDVIRMTYWRSAAPAYQLREILNIARQEEIRLPTYLLFQLSEHVDANEKVWAELQEDGVDQLRKELSTYPYRTNDSGYGLTTKGTTMTDKTASNERIEQEMRVAVGKAQARLKRASDEEEELDVVRGETSADSGAASATPYRKRSFNASELHSLVEKAASATFASRFKRFVHDGLNSEDPEERGMARELVKAMERGIDKTPEEDTRNLEIELADESEEAKRPWYMPSDTLIDDVKGYGIEGVVRLTREEAIDMIRAPVLSFWRKESGGGPTGKMVKAMGAHFFREGGKPGEAVLSGLAGAAIPFAIEAFSPEDQKLLRKASGALRKEFFGHASHMVLGSVWKEIKEPLKEALVPLLSKMKEAATTVNVAKGALGAAKTRIDVRDASRDDDVHAEVGRGRSTADRRAHKRD